MAGGEWTNDSACDCDGPHERGCHYSKPTALPYVRLGTLADSESAESVTKSSSAPGGATDVFGEEEALPLDMTERHVSQIGHGFRWGRWYLDCITSPGCPFLCYQRWSDKPRDSDYWIPYDRIDETDWIEHIDRKHWSPVAADNLELAIGELRDWMRWIQSFGKKSGEPKHRPEPQKGNTKMRTAAGFVYEADRRQTARLRSAAAADGMTPEEMIKHIVDEWVAGRLADPGDVEGEGDQ